MFNNQKMAMWRLDVFAMYCFKLKLHKKDNIHNGWKFEKWSSFQYQWSFWQTGEEIKECKKCIGILFPKPKGKQPSVYGYYR